MKRFIMLLGMTVFIYLTMSACAATTDKQICYTDELNKEWIVKIMPVDNSPEKQIKFFFFLSASIW